MCSTCEQTDKSLVLTDHFIQINPLPKLPLLCGERSRQSTLAQALVFLWTRGRPALALGV